MKIKYDIEYDTETKRYRIVIKDMKNVVDKDDDKYSELIGYLKDVAVSCFESLDKKKTRTIN